MTYTRSIRGSESMIETVARPTPLLTSKEISQQMPDSERAARRIESRRKIARADRAESEYLVIQEEILKCGQRKEEYANEHVERCRLLQSELAGLDRALVDAIINREQADPAKESRRLELLGLIREANSDLESKIKIEDQKIAMLFHEGRKVAEPISDRPGAESDLVNYLARPDLRRRLKVLQHRVDWSRRRLAGVNDNRYADEQLAVEIATDAESELAKAQTELEILTAETMNE